MRAFRFHAESGRALVVEGGHAGEDECEVAWSVGGSEQGGDRLQMSPHAGAADGVQTGELRFGLGQTVGIGGRIPQVPDPLALDPDIGAMLFAENRLGHVFLVDFRQDTRFGSKLRAQPIQPVGRRGRAPAALGHAANRAAEQEQTRSGQPPIVQGLSPSWRWARGYKLAT
jgi:hypothetical protein